MMSLGIHLALLLFVLAGCAASVRHDWYHPQGSANLGRDRYECTREAATVPQVALPAGGPPRYPTGGGFTEGLQHGQAIAAYNAAVEQAEAQRALADRLFAMCMQNRGYELREVTSEQEQLRKEKTIALDRQTRARIAGRCALRAVEEVKRGASREERIAWSRDCERQELERIRQELKR